MPQLPSALRRAARVLQIDRVTAEVVTAMQAAGIRPLLLKGPSIASWLYRDGAHRAYDDSDILVAPGSYRRAGEVLGELGFRHHEYEWLRYVQTWLRDSEPSGAQGGWPSLVDLHRSLNGVRAPADTVWDVLSTDTDTLRVGGVEVEVLCVPARALHVALHAAQHGVDVRRPVEDLGRTLRLADDHIWRDAADLARRLDALPAFAAGLRLDPEGARLAERLGLPAERTAAVALRVGTQDPVAIALESLASEEPLRTRALVLLRALAPSPLYMRDWSATRMARWPAALREGTLGLWLAYLWRPIWNLGRLPKAIIALRRARRGQAQAEDPARDASLPASGEHPNP
jgi:Uncharacterised nucleotidyltransferase